MTDRNPFDETPTVIRPNPGGRRPAVVEVAPQPLFGSTPADSAAIPADTAAILGFGPIVTAAGLLLSLAGWLGSAPPQRDLAALRQRLLSELQTFDAAARAAGQPELAVRQADYILCATLDDVIANTEWGRELDWSRQSLARTRHNDATGGDQVFRLIEDYRRDPVNSFPCLKLVYFCLTLGFEGRMRVLPAGDAEHLRLRENLLRIMRQLKGGTQGEILSPRWRGAGGGPRPAISAVPLWAIAVLAAAILTGVYVGLRFWLGDQSTEVSRQLAALPPQQRLNPAPVKSVATKQAKRISRFLEQEIAQHLVVVLDDGRNTTVRIVGSGMFASGSATVDDRFLPLITDLAHALVDTQGRILVTGHTDNQPIRYNIRFANNVELSQARARAVRNLIVADAPAVEQRIDADGRADREPVDSNDTPEARQRNRRIDLIVPPPMEDAE
jgi:type VI secretion system protein ImpK